MRKTTHFFKPEGKEEEYIRTSRAKILAFIQKSDRATIFLNKRKTNKRFITYIPINLKKLCSKISNNSEPNRQLLALKMVQKIVKSQFGPTLDEVVEAGILLATVELVDLVYGKKCILKATSIIHEFTTNVIYIMVLVNAGIVTKLTDLLDTSSKHIHENSIQCIANIISTVNKLKDDFVEYGLVQRLTRVLKLHTHYSVSSNIFLIISYIYQDGRCRYEIFQELGALLDDCNPNILLNALNILKQLTDGQLENTDVLFQSKVVEKLLVLLTFENLRVQELALLIIGNIAASKGKALDLLNECDALTYIYVLANSFGEELRSCITWCLSNFLCGTPRQIERVFETDLIPYIVYNFQHGSLGVRMEAVICLCNICICGNREQISAFTNDVVVKEFCDLLDCNNEVCIRGILRSLYNMLEEFEEQRRFLIQLITNRGALPKLESFLSSNIFDVYNYAFLIINFCEEENILKRFDRFLKFCQKI